MTPAQSCQTVQGRGGLSLTTVAPWSLWWPQCHSKSFCHSCTHNCCTLRYHMVMCRGVWLDNAEYIPNVQYNYPLGVMQPRPIQTDGFLTWRLYWFVGRFILSGLRCPVTPAQRKTPLLQASPPCRVQRASIHIASFRHISAPWELFPTQKINAGSDLC